MDHPYQSGEISHWNSCSGVQSYPDPHYLAVNGDSDDTVGDVEGSHSSGDSAARWAGGQGVAMGTGSGWKCSTHTQEP